MQPRRKTIARWHVDNITTSATRHQCHRILCITAQTACGVEERPRRLRHRNLTGRGEGVDDGGTGIHKAVSPEVENATSIGEEIHLVPRRLGENDREVPMNGVIGDVTRRRDTDRDAGTIKTNILARDKIIGQPLDPILEI